MEHHGFLFICDLIASWYPFPNPKTKNNQTTNRNHKWVRDLRILLFLQQYIICYKINLEYYLDKRSKIISDARSAIATRTEFGVPEIGDGITLASIILNPLTPFTLENVIIILSQLFHSLSSQMSSFNTSLLYLSFTLTPHLQPHHPPHLSCKCHMDGGSWVLRFS